MVRCFLWLELLLQLLCVTLDYRVITAFVPPCYKGRTQISIGVGETGVNELTIEEATTTLVEWDRWYSNENPSGSKADDPKFDRLKLSESVRVLNRNAELERTADPRTGRVILGICASTAQEGIGALKSWVTTLQLPRGLLHGMDQDGVPLQLDGGVYIKYNSGGVYTFADIRKSQKGFDALWKPGDAMLETYDGNFRGVYYQVELKDDVFRQYLIPLDFFDSIA